MDYPALIRANPQQHRRCFCIEAQGKRMWVKQDTKNYSNNLQRGVFRVLEWFGKAHVEKASHQEELRRIEALRRRGYIVPELLYRDERYVVFADLGPTLETLLKEADTGKRLALTEQLGKTFSALHSAGGWHGSAALRNLTLSPEGIGFLDFDDPSSYIMTPNGRYAYDLWKLGHSLAAFDDTGTLNRALLNSYTLERPKRILLVVAWVLLPLYLLLLPFKKKLKRDFRQMLTDLQSLYGF